MPGRRQPGSAPAGDGASVPAPAPRGGLPGLPGRILRAIPWARLAGAAGLVGASAAIFALATSASFAVDPSAAPVRGVTYTDPVAVRAALDLPDGLGMNIFRLRTAELEARIATLPSIRSARVRAWLPDRLEIDVTERAAILAWATESGVWLVDGEGRLFATAAVPDGDAPPALPIVRDRRAAPTGGLGSVLVADDLAVARALAALAPLEVGSDAKQLALSVDNGDGWVLEVPGAWHAVFGVYTPTVRPLALLPAQVQCLAGIVGAREASLERVVLAPGPDGCGTFVGGPAPRSTPRPGTRGG